MIKTLKKFKKKEYFSFLKTVYSEWPLLPTLISLLKYGDQHRSAMFGSAVYRQIYPNHKAQY